MESLLSDTYSGSNPSSREQSLDQQEHLQVPVLHLPECNGTTFHLPEQCCEDAPLTAHYHSDQEDEELEEVSAFLLCRCASEHHRLFNWFVIYNGTF